MSQICVVCIATAWWRPGNISAVLEELASLSSGILLLALVDQLLLGIPLTLVKCFDISLAQHFQCYQIEPNCILPKHLLAWLVLVVGTFTSTETLVLTTCHHETSGRSNDTLIWRCGAASVTYLISKCKRGKSGADVEIILARRWRRRLLRDPWSEEQQLRKTKKPLLQ